jgi:hypothetical protein
MNRCPRQTGVLPISLPFRSLTCMSSCISITLTNRNLLTASISASLSIVEASHMHLLSIPICSASKSDKYALPIVVPFQSSVSFAASTECLSVSLILMPEPTPLSFLSPTEIAPRLAVAFHSNAFHFKFACKCG